MQSLREDYYPTWKGAYDTLNVAQREAVDQTEGAVMAIAGPGTGKTQLLAVRIGKILLETQADPHNILCLTYTDAGAIAMRQRLASLIGPEAYNVNIHTFHAFCNGVIRDNSPYFGNYRELQLISEIEEIELYRALLDGLPDNHTFKRFKGDRYFDAKRLKSFFATMKQEGWTYPMIQEQYEQFCAHMRDPATAGDEYVYKRKHTDKSTGITYQAGDFNQRKAETEIAKFDQLVPAAQLLDTYNQLMAERRRFDYQDMILWVVDTFRKHDDLLAKYQERFQYILVDEYQDTNGSQNTLLFQLADFWDDPNVFIVGDDDQSIFRFQGANMNSILEFRERFRPKEIVLTENYRSSQVILDTSRRLIENNEDRLVNRFDNLVKILVEKRRDAPAVSPDPELHCFVNESQEEAWVLHTIEALKESGVEPHTIAVLYTKHRIVENMVRYCTQKGIPVNVKKRVNVLREKEVLQLTTLLDWLHSEYTRPHSAEDRLFDILHFGCFQLSPLDIAAVTVYCRRRREDEVIPFRQWRDVLNDAAQLSAAGVRNTEGMLAAARTLEKWISLIPNVTIQTLIERILSDSGMLTDVLRSGDKAWKLQLINTFFDFVKEEAAKKGDLSLAELMHMLGLMEENELELPISRIITSQNGIHFLTAHSAKGLEFDHVFIVRTNSQQWEKKQGNQQNISLVPTLTASRHATGEEDDRRLMYVAMTRAKNHLYITWPIASDAEKPLEPSRFIAEIAPLSDIKATHVPDSWIENYKNEVLRYQQGSLSLIDHDLVDRLLEDFKMSATSLNKFLRCRLAFYFENLLRVPMGRSASMGFGSAIHHALEYYFIDFENSQPRSLPSAARLAEYYTKGMDTYRSHFTADEYDNLLTHGLAVLQEYYEKYHQEWWVARKYEPEVNIRQTEYKGIPISGKLDRVDIYDDHVAVTDYKTGGYDAKKVKEPTGEGDIGGDYWRQIIFYRLLLDGDTQHKWTLKRGIMDFVEKGKDGVFRRREYTIAPFEVEWVGRQLEEAYAAIKAHEFTQGCGDKDCHWCNFVIRNMPVVVVPDSDDQ